MTGSKVDVWTVDFRRKPGNKNSVGATASSYAVCVGAHARTSLAAARGV